MMERFEVNLKLTSHESGLAVLRATKNPLGPSEQGIALKLLEEPDVYVVAVYHNNGHHDLWTVCFDEKLSPYLKPILQQNSPEIFLEQASLFQFDLRMVTISGTSDTLPIEDIRAAIVKHTDINGLNMPDKPTSDQEGFSA